MKPLLRFEQVTCRRGGRLLFEGLDLALGPGEALQVTGPNGSGKSSLIRIAAGLLKPERGVVKRSAFALFDDSIALDHELPLERALRFWGGSADVGLNALGLAELAKVPVRLLSAGQAKRASLARVAASGASLWFLDEPANALDSTSLGLLADLLDRHRSSGGAVLAASHSPLPGEWHTLELGR
ncbi:MAG TPA: heme ABC exporter ATP-binding protein CcmA [Sphingomicrobium sp.]|nr:heme ABC exporter ATP-binding protein CcmA [Sphingomicrobium sp.]